MNLSEPFDAVLPQIRGIQLFGYLTDDELQKILAVSELVTFEADQNIVRFGEASPFLFGVVSGQVHVTLEETGDQQIFICTIAEGEVFGESAIFMSERRTANVTSAGTTVLLRIHRKEMMRFIKENPTAGNKILMLIIYGLLNKLRDANQEMALEKQSVIDINDIDGLIQEFMEDR